MREMQSHYVIDEIQGSACCLLCGTLEDPFVGCEHKAQMLYDSMEANRNGEKESNRVQQVILSDESLSGESDSY
jgi:hypothetical protein